MVNYVTLVEIYEGTVSQNYIVRKGKSIFIVFTDNNSLLYSYNKI